MAQRRSRRKAATDREAFAHVTPDAYLECRRRGRHDYESITVDPVPKERIIVVFEKCADCGHERTQWWADNTTAYPGEILLTRGGRYPKGYVAEGLGRMDAVDRGRFRIEWALRKTGKVKGVPLPEED